MRKRLLAVLLALGLLCGCAGAEGLFSSWSHGVGLAVVGGEVYCAGANVGLGFIPIWRIGNDGLDKLCARIGGWSGLFALGNELLTLEPVLDIGEMLGSIPTSAYKVKQRDPATGKAHDFTTFVWNAEDGVCNIFAAKGKVYRDVAAGMQHVLECLEGDEWVAVAAWAGEPADVFESFCIIGDRHADKPEYIALYEFATGKAYDVTRQMARDVLWLLGGAVLENGVLYRLQERSFTAFNLAESKQETLASLPEGMDTFILTDTELILMSFKHQQAWVLDRDGWEITRQVKMTEYPQDAALHEGKLYVYCAYGDDAGVEVIDLASGESTWYALK